MIIAATLHDSGSAPSALPDSKLILSTYLENFQPDTTPVLPDLLHPNQTANGLGGFMTGKAALVNAAGRVGYRGGLLAEVFLDNSVHLGRRPPARQRAGYRSYSAHRGRLHPE